VPLHTDARLLRYIDVVLVFAAAPLLLPFGAPVIGYGIGGGAWILLRVLGVAVNRRASVVDDLGQQVALRLAYRFVRVLLLVAAGILARGAGGSDDGLTALLLITVAFTVQLSVSISERPRSLSVAGSFEQARETV
jgi:hypothetical protein